MRQVAHVLLTRPPLNPFPKELHSLDLHVLGTPPAFVLSQDQTLAFDSVLNPEVLPSGSKLIYELTVFVLMRLVKIASRVCLLYSVSFSRICAVQALSRDSSVSIHPPAPFVNTFLKLFVSVFVGLIVN